jgi:N-glycosylase/DNA lyase
MEIHAPDFDLALTLDSGQVFHWEKVGQGFAGTIGDQPVYLEQQKQKLLVGSKPTARLCRHYFGLDHPLKEICASFPDEPVMREAVTFCQGLRILRQPRWECLATFITSSMKQVAHIRQISLRLRKQFGKAHSLGQLTIYSYPTPERIAALNERQLRECALGYRAKNLLATAQRITDGRVDLESLAALSDDELRARLCELPGVGMKVANCVLLFAYERLRAFPIDVWIERVLREKYFSRRRQPTVRELREFASNHFGKHGGYAQQYLFHHVRKTTQRRLSRKAS